jgi:hypothetical protein
MVDDLPIVLWWSTADRGVDDLESERPARDRGFESPRFRHCDQHER